MNGIGINIADLGEHYKGILEEGFKQSFANGERLRAEIKESNEKADQTRQDRKQAAEAAAEASAARAEAANPEGARTEAGAETGVAEDSGVRSTAALLDQLVSPNGGGEGSSFERRGAVAAYGRNANLALNPMAAYRKNA